MANLRELLKISATRIDEINALLVDPKNETVTELLKVVERYGGPEEINRKAAEAVRLENLMARLEKAKSPYVKDLDVADRATRREGLYLHGGLPPQGQGCAGGPKSEECRDA